VNTTQFLEGNGLFEFLVEFVRRGKLWDLKIVDSVPLAQESSFSDN